MEIIKLHRGEDMPTNIDGAATRLWLLYCKSIHIRTFHVTWFTFWLCFFGWFATANLGVYITEDIGLTIFDKGLAGGLSVASTVIFRVIVGQYCDIYGARRLYPLLLICSAIPIACAALVKDNIGYIIVHFFIGIAGASFVITQYHCSRMFAGKIVGTANATSAGWGNFGGGCANALMPLLFDVLKRDYNLKDSEAWRYCMLFPSGAMIIMAFVYYFVTQDTPNGNINEINNNNGNNNNANNKNNANKGKDTENRAGKGEEGGNNETNKKNTNNSKNKKTDSSSDNNNNPLMTAIADYRTWILFFVYAACFGMELTILRFGSTYLQDEFNISIEEAGLVIGLFSIMNLFARPLGGGTGDYLSEKYGLKGRVYGLFIILLFESIALFAFGMGSQFNKNSDGLIYSIILIVAFSIFVQASEGLTFAIVPFIQPNAIGPVAGIVGAGGNAGALVFALCLFAYVDTVTYPIAWTVCSIFAFIISFSVLFIKFDESEMVAAEGKMRTFRAAPTDIDDIRAEFEDEDEDDDTKKNTNKNKNGNKNGVRQKKLRSVSIGDKHTPRSNMDAKDVKNASTGEVQELV